MTNYLYKEKDELYIFDDIKQDDIYILVRVNDLSKKYNLPKYTILVEMDETVAAVQERLSKKLLIPLKGYKFTETTIAFFEPFICYAVYYNEKIFRQKLLQDLRKVKNINQLLHFNKKYSWYTHYLDYNKGNKSKKYKV